MATDLLGLLQSYRLSIVGSFNNAASERNRNDIGFVAVRDLRPGGISTAVWGESADLSGAVSVIPADTPVRFPNQPK